MEEEKIDPINCSAVVRAVKQSGTFMLLDRDEEHYLVTETFILYTCASAMRSGFSASWK